MGAASCPRPACPPPGAPPLSSSAVPLLSARSQTLVPLSLSVAPPCGLDGRLIHLSKGPLIGGMERMSEGVCVH